MSASDHYLAFTLDQHRFALALAEVERVVPALELTPLPGAPHLAAGIFNLQGKIVTAISLRRRFGLPDRELAISDHFIVTRALGRTIALMVDDTQGIVSSTPGEIVPAAAFLPEQPYVCGVMRRPDGIVLIQDLGRLLTTDEDQHLERVLREAGAS